MSKTENMGDSVIEGGESISSGTFSLQVISPSVGFTGPLSFPQLPIATTVKQLKEKIRESLSMRPSDDHQRLIYRGRLLAREDETMSEIFGQETLKASESHALHLVLRPSTSESSSTQTMANLPHQQAPPPFQPFRLPPPPRLPEALWQIPEEGRPRTTNLPTNPETTREIRIPTPPHFHAPPLPPPVRFPNEQARPNHEVHHHHQDPHAVQTMQVLQQLQQDHVRLHQERLTQQHPVPSVPGTPPHPNPIQSPAVMPSFQHLIAQHQRDRAALGMQGVQHQANRIMHRPQQTRTSTHEMTGPNGERWTVTVNETTTVFLNTNGAPPQTRSALETSSLRDVQDIVQNIVRAVGGNANAAHTTPQQGETNSSTNPALSAGTDRAMNRPANATSPNTSTLAPLPTNNVRASSEHLVPTTEGPLSAPTLSGPMVYILSSPTGPRGLVVSPSENGLEAFYTPRRQVHWDTVRQAQQPQNAIQAQNNAAIGLPEVRNRREGRHGHGNRHINRHAEAAARAAPGVAHPANPPAGVVAAQMWPHIWLVVRLLGFVWFFTSGSNSWWRLFMISVVAFVIFIASTGVFNGIAEQVWGPVRRHLEALLPLAVPNAPQPILHNQPAAPQTPGAAALAQGQVDGVAAGTLGALVTPLDPAQTAARLLEQRRVANENWIWTQFRRLEHATILFVASLVPGLGERHIAARVAEENLLLDAQRQHREAEAAVAEAVARVAEGGQENGMDASATDADTPTTGVDTPTTSAEEGSAPFQGQDENATRGGNVRAGEAPTQPLVEV